MPPRAIQRSCLKGRGAHYITTREMEVKTAKRYCLILGRKAVIKDPGNKYADGESS